MTDYETAFKRPFSDVKKLVIAMLLNIVPVVNLLVYGWLLEVARSSGNRKNVSTLPDWKDWGKLVVNALLALVVSLAYALPLLLVGLIVGFRMFASMFTGQMMMWSALSSMGVWLVFLVIYGLFFIYVLPSAILAFAFSGKLSSAFEFGNVIKRAFNVEYFVPWLVSIVYSALAGAVLGWIPWVGRAVAGTITGITMFTLLGEVYPSLGSSKPLKRKR